MINLSGETAPAPLASSKSNPALDDYGRVLPNQNYQSVFGVIISTSVMPDGSSIQILINTDGTSTQTIINSSGQVTTKNFAADGSLITQAVIKQPPSTPILTANAHTTMTSHVTDADGSTTTTTLIINPDGTRTLTASNVAGITTVTYAANSNTIIIPAVTVTSTVIRNSDNTVTYIAPDGTTSVLAINNNNSNTITVTPTNSSLSVVTPSNINAITAANPTANSVASTTNNQVLDLPKTSIINNPDGSKTMLQTSLAGTVTTIINADGSYGLSVFKAAPQLQIGPVYSTDPNTAGWLQAQTTVANLQAIVLTPQQQQQLLITKQVSLTTSQQQMSLANDALILQQKQFTDMLKLQGLPPTAPAAGVSLIVGI